MLKQFIVVLLTIYSCVAQDGEENQPPKIKFECGASVNGEPSKEIIVNGGKYQCPNDKVCDDITPNATVPCVEVGDICANAGFTCTDDGTVNFNDNFKVKCSDGLLCNNDKKYPCKACIENKVACDKKWTCPGPTDRHVSYMGLLLTCDQVSKCNEGTNPCAPCVSRATGRATNYN